MFCNLFDVVCISDSYKQQKIYKKNISTFALHLNQHHQWQRSWCCRDINCSFICLSKLPRDE